MDRAFSSPVPTRRSSPSFRSDPPPAPVRRPAFTRPLGNVQPIGSFFTNDSLRQWNTNGFTDSEGNFFATESPPRQFKRVRSLASVSLTPKL